MSLLDSALASITPIDADALAAAEERQQDLTKPAGSLDQLETLGNRLAGIAGVCPPPVPEPARLFIFAADHGVQVHKVSPWPQEVTAQMVANVVSGGAAVAVLSRQMGVDYQVVDMGTLTPSQDGFGVLDRRLGAGTADLATGPAMTRDQAIQGIETGIALAKEAVASGYRVLLPGELGIGNTTPSTALISVFTGLPAAEVTGAGAGADAAMVAHKSALIARAIEERQVSAADPIGALAEVGGFEHAAITGLILGAAAERVPLILDGVITCSAALVAAALRPEVKGYLIAGHEGVEPGIRAALASLDLVEVVSLGMRLGEGTGAVVALPIVQAAAHILGEMATFSQAGVSGRE